MSILNVKFSNLGPISKGELDLNELTIITGDNNVGKTYVSYLIYNILNDCIIKIFHVFLNDRELFNKFYKRDLCAELKEKRQVFIAKEDLKIINNFVIKRYSEYIKNDLSSFFNITDSASFNDLDLKVTFGFDKEISIGFDNSSDIILDLEEKLENSKEIVMAIINFWIHSKYKHVAMITAERLGIVLFRKEIDARRSNIINQLQVNVKEKSKKKKLPDDLVISLIENYTARYSYPVHKNIEYARDLSMSRNLGKFDKNENLSKKLKTLIGGNYKFIKETEEIMFKPNKEKIEIPLHFTSSSVRSLMMLFHYLKYNAKKGDIIFIDEPESNLSVKKQIELIRFIVICVNKGVRFFITTHSDMMIKELNNLVRYSSIDKKLANQLGYSFKEYSEDMELDYKKVSLYEIKNKKINKINVKANGFSINIFDDAINTLNEINDKLDFVESFGDDDD